MFHIFLENVKAGLNFSKITGSGAFCCRLAMSDAAWPGEPSGKTSPLSSFCSTIDNTHENYGETDEHISTVAAKIWYRISSEHQLL